MKKPLYLHGWAQGACAPFSGAKSRGFPQYIIYKGTIKVFCVSNIAAVGSCPIVDLQAAIIENKHIFSFYSFVALLLFDSLPGRFIEFSLPFIQELFHKNPTRKKRVPSRVDIPLLLLTTALSMLVYRPFCRYVCHPGAFYALSILEACPSDATFLRALNFPKFIRRRCRIHACKRDIFSFLRSVHHKIAFFCGMKG